LAFGDLTALADVRAWLQTGPQPYPATDDALLSRLITAASQFVQSWLNRPVLSGDWQEVRDGPGNFTDEVSFVCAVQPVTAVLLVVVDGLTIPPDPTGYLPNFVPAAPGNISPSFLTPTSSLAGYVYTPSAISVRGYWVPRKRASVLLRYTAGFAAVPFDIAQATIELVGRKYRERTRIGERSKHLGGAETVSYETTTFSLRDMASDIQLLLQQYRMVMPILSGPPVPAPTSFDPATLAAIA
jgi:hypothetical protein